jgi:hypothetical protein
MQEELKRDRQREARDGALAEKKRKKGNDDHKQQEEQEFKRMNTLSLSPDEKKELIGKVTKMTGRWKRHKRRLAHEPAQRQRHAAKIKNDAEAAKRNRGDDDDDDDASDDGTPPDSPARNVERPIDIRQMLRCCVTLSFRASGAVAQQAETNQEIERVFPNELRRIMQISSDKVKVPVEMRCRGSIGRRTYEPVNATITLD